MDYPRPFVAVFWPILEQAIPAFGFTVVDVKEDPTHPWYAAWFHNDQVEMKCELERGRPAIALKRHDGEHWFQLSRALRALTGNVQDPLDVGALTRFFMEEYPKLISSLDTQPFNELYLEQFSSLGSYRPW